MWQGHFCVEKIIDDYYGGIFNLTKYQIDTIIMIISKKKEVVIMKKKVETLRENEEYVKAYDD